MYETKREIFSITPITGVLYCFLPRTTVQSVVQIKLKTKHLKLYVATFVYLYGTYLLLNIVSAHSFQLIYSAYFRLRGKRKNDRGRFKTDVLFLILNKNP